MCLTIETTNRICRMKKEHKGNISVKFINSLKKEGFSIDERLEFYERNFYQDWNVGRFNGYIIFKGFGKTIIKNVSSLYSYCFTNSGKLVYIGLGEKTEYIKFYRGIE